MKIKKLMKRVMEARGSKKGSKKVRKRNRKFLENLIFCNADEVLEEKKGKKSSKTTVTIDTGAEIPTIKPTKELCLEWLRKAVADATTTIDEGIIKSNKVKSFKVTEARFEFYKSIDPVVVLLSKDIDIDSVIKRFESKVDINETEVEAND